MTIVRNVSDLPYYLDTFLSTPPGRTHLYFENTPLFPFGFGLSYAKFQYSSMLVRPNVIRAQQPAVDYFNVTCTVDHIGGMVSDEVTQVYGSFHRPSTGLASIPRQQLLGFKRLYLLKNRSSTHVTIQIMLADLHLIDPLRTMRLQEGTWTIYVGGGGPSSAKYGGSAVLQSTLVLQ